MLRDIKTRFGASYFGFLFGLLVPLGHIAALLTIYMVLGRRAPIGTDVTIFVTTALLPFVCWSYTYQRVLRSFGDNRAMLSFPIVRPIDIPIARTLVELMNSALIVAVVYLALVLTGSDVFIFDTSGVVFALLLSFALGASMGAVCGLLSSAAPGLTLAFYLFVPIYWATSGNLFIPDALPEVVRGVVRIFPLAHIVEFGRAAYYPSYYTDFYSIKYVASVIVANLAAFLMLSRFGRNTFLTK